MITPTRIEVRNVRSVTHAVIEPAAEGITSLHGPVGSGKSTVLVSFLWCLYGPVGGVAGLPAQEDMRRRGVTEPVEVSVDFTMNGNTFRAVRRLRLNKAGTKETASAELWIDGVKQPQITPSKLTDKIESLTGLTGRAFAGAFFMAQNALPRLAEGTPSEVQNIFEQQTGISTLTRQIEAASSAARDAQTRADALPGSVEDVKAAQHEVDEAQKAAETVWATLEQVQTRHARATENSTAAQGEADRLQAQQRAAQQASMKVAQLDGQIESARAQLGEARETAQAMPLVDVDGLPRRVDELRELINTVRTAFDRAQQAEQNIEQARREAEQARQAMPPAPQLNVDEVTQQENQLGNRLAALRAEYNQYATQARKLQELNGTHCPTCTQALPDPSIIMGPINEALQRLAHQGKELGAHHQHVAQQAAQARQQAEAYARAEQQARDAATRAEQTQRTQQGTAEAAHQAHEQLRAFMGADERMPVADLVRAGVEQGETWQKQITTAQQAQQAHERVARIERGLDELQNTRTQTAQQAGHAPDDETVTQALTAAASAREALDAVNGELREAQREADILTERVRGAEKTRDMEQKLMDAKSEALIAADVERHARDVTVAFRRDLVAEYTATVSAAATDYMEQVGGDHVGVHVDHTFVPCVLLADGTKVPMRTLSGGEKVRAATCFYLGISDQIAGTSGDGMIFADEITSAYDTETTMRIVDLLRSVGRPMIVVSHTDQVQQVATRVIQFTKPDESTGTIIENAEETLIADTIDAA